jgi:glutathione-regulated potassium-efflux system ancillary protein KefC
MDNVWALASVWVGLALLATLIAIWLKISTALTEIVVGTVAQLAIGALVGPKGLGAKTDWITFLAGTGAIVLTFLAGAELDPASFRAKWKEATVIGLVGFTGRFLVALLSRITYCIGALHRAGWPGWLFRRHPSRSCTR